MDAAGAALVNGTSTHGEDFDDTLEGTPIRVGAMVIPAVLAAAAADDPKTELLGFFVRKETKQHGLGRRIEGGFREGQTVALIEDTVTTGGSTLEAFDAVEAEGGKVARVLCLVDRGEGAAAAFSERGIQLESIYDRKDLPV